MGQSRHSGRVAADYDRKVDFVTPESRDGSARTASHRFIRSESRPRMSMRPAGSQRGVEEEFSETEFKARWWPAPDAWQ